MIANIIILIWLHFIADFLAQTKWMAENKSSSNLALCVHVIIYTIIFMVISIDFAIINGILHFITDYITSRWTKSLWDKKEVRKFFIVIGLDQAIHMSTLFLTYWWLVL